MVSAASEPTRANVVANLASSYAEGDQRVIVISALDIKFQFRRRKTLELGWGQA